MSSSSSQRKQVGLGGRSPYEVAAAPASSAATAGSSGARHNGGPYDDLSTPLPSSLSSLVTAPTAASAAAAGLPPATLDAAKQSAIARQVEDYNHILDTIGQPNYHVIRDLFSGDGCTPADTTPVINVSFELFETIQSRFVATKQTLERTKNDLLARNQQLTALQGEMMTLKGEHSLTQRRAAEAEERNTQLHQQVAKYEVTMEQLRRQLGQAQVEADQMQERLLKREDELQAAQHRTTECLVTLSQKDAVITTLRRELGKHGRFARHGEEGEDDGSDVGPYTAEALQSIAADVEGRTQEARMKLSAADFEAKLRRAEQERVFILAQHDQYLRHVEHVVAAYESQCMTLEDGVAAHACVTTPYFLSATFYQDLLNRQKARDSTPAPEHDGEDEMHLEQVASFYELALETRHSLDRLAKISVDPTSQMTDELMQCIAAQQTVLQVSADLVGFLTTFEKEVTEARLSLPEVREEWNKARVPFFATRAAQKLGDGVTTLSTALVRLLERENEYADAVANAVAAAPAPPSTEASERSKTPSLSLGQPPRLAAMVHVGTMTGPTHHKHRAIQVGGDGAVDDGGTDDADDSRRSSSNARASLALGHSGRTSSLSRGDTAATSAERAAEARGEGRERVRSAGKIGDRAEKTAAAAPTAWEGGNSNSNSNRSNSNTALHQHRDSHHPSESDNDEERRDAAAGMGGTRDAGCLGRSSGPISPLPRFCPHCHCSLAHDANNKLGAAGSGETAGVDGNGAPMSSEDAEAAAAAASGYGEAATPHPSVSANNHGDGTSAELQATPGLVVDGGTQPPRRVSGGSHSSPPGEQRVSSSSSKDPQRGGGGRLPGDNSSKSGGASAAGTGGAGSTAVGGSHQVSPTPSQSTATSARVTVAEVAGEGKWEKLLRAAQAELEELRAFKAGILARSRHPQGSWHGEKSEKTAEKSRRTEEEDEDREDDLSFFRSVHNTANSGGSNHNTAHGTAGGHATPPTQQSERRKRRAKGDPVAEAAPPLPTASSSGGTAGRRVDKTEDNPATAGEMHNPPSSAPRSTRPAHATHTSKDVRSGGSKRTQSRTGAANSGGEAALPTSAKQQHTRRPPTSVASPPASGKQPANKKAEGGPSSSKSLGGSSSRVPHGSVSFASSETVKPSAEGEGHPATDEHAAEQADDVAMGQAAASSTTSTSSSPIQAHQEGSGALRASTASNSNSSNSNRQSHPVSLSPGGGIGDGGDGSSSLPFTSPAPALPASETNSRNKSGSRGSSHGASLAVPSTGLAGDEDRRGAPDTAEESAGPAGEAAFFPSTRHSSRASSINFFAVAESGSAPNAATIAASKEGSSSPGGGGGVSGGERLGQSENPAAVVAGAVQPSPLPPPFSGAEQPKHADIVSLVKQAVRGKRGGGGGGLGGDGHTTTTGATAHDDSGTRPLIHVQRRGRIPVPPARRRSQSSGTGEAQSTWARTYAAAHRPLPFPAPSYRTSWPVEGGEVRVGRGGGLSGAPMLPQLHSQGISPGWTTNPANGPYDRLNPLPAQGDQDAKGTPATDFVSSGTHMLLSTYKTPLYAHQRRMQRHHEQQHQLQLRRQQMLREHQQRRRQLLMKRQTSAAPYPYPVPGSALWKLDEHYTTTPSGPRDTNSAVSSSPAVALSLRLGDGGGHRGVEEKETVMLVGHPYGHITSGGSASAPRDTPPRFSTVFPPPRRHIALTFARRHRSGVMVKRPLLYQSLLYSPHRHSHRHNDPDTEFRGEVVCDAITSAASQSHPTQQQRQLSPPLRPVSLTSTNGQTSYLTQSLLSGYSGIGNGNGYGGGARGGGAALSVTGITPLLLSHHRNQYPLLSRIGPSSGGGGGGGVAPQLPVLRTLSQQQRQHQQQQQQQPSRTPAPPTLPKMTRSGAGSGGPSKLSGAPIRSKPR